MSDRYGSITIYETDRKCPTTKKEEIVVIAVVTEIFGR